MFARREATVKRNSTKPCKGSWFFDYEIHHPAASDVRPSAAAVAQDVVVRAAGFFQRVGEDGHVLEAALGVDGAGKGGGLECLTRSIKDDRAKRVAENFPEDGAFSSPDASKYSFIQPFQIYGRHI
jgi:hypothetical protein